MTRTSLRASGRAPTGTWSSPSDVASLALLSMLWGGTFLFIELAVRALAPIWVVVGRTFLGVLVLLTVVSIRRLALPRGMRLWMHLAFLAIPGNVIPWTLVAWAQQSVPSGLTAVLYALMPIVTYVASSVTRMESFTGRRALGLVTALAGTAIAVWPRMGAPDELAGVLAILAATLFLSAGAVYAKRFVSHQVRPVPMAAGQLLVGFTASLVAALLTSPIPAGSDLTAMVVLSLAALGALSTGLAFVVYYRLIDRVGATNATLVSYFIPVVGLVAGWLVLSERITPAIVVGAAVILGGIALSSVPRPPPAGPIADPR